MKRILLGTALILSAAVSSGTAYGGEKVNVIDSFLYTNWLTEDHVNFGNLKYTDTYPVFFFWQQCSS